MSWICRQQTMIFYFSTDHRHFGFFKRLNEKKYWVACDNELQLPHNYGRHSSAYGNNAVFEIKNVVAILELNFLAF